MPGTDLAYGAICLRACDAILRTDLAYGDTGVRACYAMSGTDLAYGAMPIAAVKYVCSPIVYAIDGLHPTLLRFPYAMS
eukprot:3941419-Rhodomonas_salina.3